MERHGRVLAVLLTLALLFAACGDGDDGTAESPSPADGDTPTETEIGTETEAAAAETCEDVDLASPPDEPTTIRFGHGVAAEEPFWLMTVMPDNTQYQDQWYEMDLQQFRGTEERLVAYQAGELDAVIITPNALVTGTAADSLDLYNIVTVMQDAFEGAFSTSFIALEESGITDLEDLQGQQIAVVDLGSHLDFLARVAMQEAGHDPEADAEYVVLPFPAQEDALRQGQIDVAGLPEPFYSAAHAAGGVVDVFNAADVLDFSFDLLTLAFDRQFVEDNLGAVCAWVDDYQSSMEFYRSENEEARRALAASDFVPLPEEVYLATGDYARPEGGTVDVDGLQQFIDGMIDFGLLDESERVDPQTLVKPGVSAGQ